MARAPPLRGASLLPKQTQVVPGVRAHNVAVVSCDASAPSGLVG